MSQELLYWQALNRAMDHAMAADESVFTLGEDVGLYGGSYRVTEGLYAKYGEWRVRDTPISEGGFTGLGVGAALVGMRPVVEIMTINFMLLALDSIINGAAKIPFMSGGQFKMPLVVRVPGGVARQLGAQHAQRLEHTVMNVPGLRIAVPSTPQDAYWQLRQAIASDDPIILLEHELLVFHQGSGRRHGRSAAHAPRRRASRRRRSDDRELFAPCRPGAGGGAAELAKEGIEAEVIDLRSLSPIDWDTCAASVEKTHRSPGRRGGLPVRRRRCGDRGDADRALLRFARRAGAAAGRSRYSDALQRRARGGDDTAGRRYRRPRRGNCAEATTPETKAA